MFLCKLQDKTHAHIACTQSYTMADQYEHVNLGDFDVVRSTQFVEDLGRGVHDLTLKFCCIYQTVTHGSLGQWGASHELCVYRV